MLTADVFAEPLWKPWLHITQKYDYRACWSFPIKTKDKNTIGTFAMYFQLPRAAKAEDIAMADIVTQTAAVLIANDTNDRERRKAEHTLRENEQQLKQLLKLRDDFIGIASHELNTPVTTMKIYAEMVQEQMEEANRLESIELVLRLNEQINRLSSLIAILLDTTKIAEGHLKLKPEEIDINALVSERIEEISRVAKHQFKLEAQEIPAIIADRERIGQVLTNLLSNAIKYSKKETTITICLAVEDQNIKISVQDQGYGIPEDDVEKVFERFFRVTANHMDTYPGMGLGLYIADQIIKKHGGTISVESKEGIGSTFSFTLPLMNGDLC